MAERKDDLLPFAPEMIAAVSCPALEGEGHAVAFFHVAAEDYAKQITIRDFGIFKCITREELLDGAWMQADKTTRAPNIVAFTAVFNDVSFWVGSLVVNAHDMECRAAIISHFITIAQCLYSMGNLHSLFAVLCGLRSSAVYRLTKTWRRVKSKDIDRLSKLQEFMSESENFLCVREFLYTHPRPCIPYLGMFLTDLTFMRSAHHGDDRETNTLIADLLSYQESQYDVIIDDAIQESLLETHLVRDMKSITSELYRLSLEIQPKLDPGSTATSPVHVLESPRRSRSILPPMDYGHRKAFSLGNSMNHVLARMKPHLGHETKASITSSVADVSDGEHASSTLPKNFHLDVSRARTSLDSVLSSAMTPTPTAATMSADPTSSRGVTPQPSAVIIKEGPLARKTSTLRKYKPQYVMVSSAGVMTIYDRAPNGPSDARVARWQGSLRNARVVPASTTTGAAFIVRANDGSVSFKFRVPSVHDRNGWMAAIQSAVDNASFVPYSQWKTTTTYSPSTTTATISPTTTNIATTTISSATTTPTTTPTTNIPNVPFIIIPSTSNLTAVSLPTPYSSTTLLASDKV